MIDPRTGLEIPAFASRECLGDDPLIARLETFLAQQLIEIAGVDFIETVGGRRVVYDVNTNTNYNAGAEADAEIPAARFLGDLLVAQDQRLPIG